MDFQLSEEQEMLVKSVQAFVNKELLPHEEEVDRQDVVSPELAAELRRKAQDAGLYAFNMPKEGGGPGLDFVSQALIERELSKCSWALHVNVGRPSNILMACQGDQIDEYLKPCVAGNKVDCFIDLIDLNITADLKDLINNPRITRNRERIIWKGLRLRKFGLSS